MITREAQVFSSVFSDFCKRTADIIGGSVTASRVERLIRASNDGKHIFHGVKRYKDVAGVEQEGILPLTPEGGNVSYWTCGFRIFGSSLDNPRLVNLFDTPFFNYSHSRGVNNLSQMTIAVSNYEQLYQAGILEKPFKNDSYLTISKPVSVENIALLIVQTGAGDPSAVQQRMFDLMENSLENSYCGGQTISLTAPSCKEAA